MTNSLSRHCIAAAAVLLSGSLPTTWFIAQAAADAATPASSAHLARGLSCTARPEGLKQREVGL